MHVTPVLLIILDGFGHREECDNNAICQARKPHWNFFWKTCPHTTIDASEQWVGLPAAQMGNSEVGHLNIGAGRVVMQDLPRVTDAIDNNELGQIAALNDLIARTLGPRLTDIWGRQVVVDNRPGGGSLIAVEIVANAVPDGHTLLTTGTSVVVNTSTPLAPPGVKIDIERDFAHVILFATGANVLSVRAASPLKSLKDVITAARARPASLTYGSSGFGSSNHFSGELLMAQAGIKLVHVPYKGNAPALTDAVGGQIDLVFAGVPAQQALLKAGRLRALAIGSK